MVMLSSFTIKYRVLLNAVVCDIYDLLCYSANDLDICVGDMIEKPPRSRRMKCHTTVYQ